MRVDHDELDGIREEVERMARAVFERVAEAVDVGDRVVLVRELSVRWRLPADRLDDVEAHARFADDLVRALAPAWEAALEPPEPGAQVVVFANRAAWWAGSLGAWAKGTTAWYHARLLADGRPLAKMLEEDADALREALTLLEPEEDLRRVLAATETPTLLRLAASFGAGDIAGPPSDGRRSLVTRITRLLSVSEAPGTAPVRGRSPTDAPPEREPARELRRTGVSGGVVRSDVADPLELQRGVSARASAEGPRESRVRARPTEEGEPDGPERVPDADRVVTQFAGLFYLLPLLLELEAGPTIWAAGLPEGAVLGAGARILIGEEDPAISALAGERARVHAPALASVEGDSAETDVNLRVLGELARALERRPAGAPRDLEVQVRRGALLAAVQGHPFVVFSADAASPGAVAAGLRALSGAWPGSLVCPPRLAPWVPPGRYRLCARSQALPALPSDGSRLGASIVGAAATLFCERVGERPPTVAAFVTEHLALGGVLVLGDAELTVRIPASRVSFAVRRAGLDRDAGWVGWLERTVRLEFVGGEPDELEPDAPVEATTEGVL